MWIYLILAVAIILAVAYLYGTFDSVVIYKDKLNSPHLMYYPFEGRNDQLSAQFQKIKKDASLHFILTNNLFRIYYSDPLQSICKCVIGFEVNAGEFNKANQFLAKNESYKLANLKSTRYVGCTLPYFNQISFIFNVKKIKDFLEILNQKKIERARLLIQRFNFSPLILKTVEIINPVDNQKQWSQL